MLQRTTIAISALLILISTTLFAADWPQFRGPNANGISAEKGINKAWNQRPPKQIWKVPMTDNGYAGPSVAVGKVFILDHKDGQDIVKALDLNTGAEAWKYSYPDTEPENHGYSQSTPTVSSGRVYALGRMGLLNCLDAKTGKLLWSRNIFTEFKGKMPNWNYAMSVLIDGNKCIVCPGGPGAAVVALDKTTGKTIWQGGGSRAMDYSSPILATINGRRQYVVLTKTDLIGLDPDTGADVWSFDWTGKNHIPQPTVIGNSVFLTNGYGQGCAMADITTTGATKRWENKEMQAHMASPIFLNGYMYGNTDPGDLICLDPNTGETKWRQNGFEKGPVTMADGVLLVFDGKGGDLVMVDPNPTAYKELGRFKPLGGQSWTAPIIANGKLIVRNTKELACFDLK
jgi:outer membrane protein assembly factor BamB